MKTKKGKLSATERGLTFAAARRKHSGAESAINKPEHRGLNRIRLRGSNWFELAVGLSALAFNIQRIRLILREKERKRIGGDDENSPTERHLPPKSRRPLGGKRRSLRRRPGKSRRQGKAASPGGGLVSALKTHLKTL